MKFFLYSSALLLSSVSQYLLSNGAVAASLHTPDQLKETLATQPNLPVVSSSAALADELGLLDSTKQKEQTAAQPDSSPVSWHDASSVKNSTLPEKTAQPQPADLANANANEQLEFPSDSLELSQRRRPTRVAPARRRPVVQPTVPINQPAQVIPEAPSQGGSEDLATTALRSLATRYNCSAAVLQSGRQLTRNEFASGLLDCIDKMEEVIANRASGSLQANSSVQGDLANLSALQQEFASELATLIIRLDQKADRSSQLTEVAQATSTFSTTTKLAGEVIVGLTAFSGNTGPAANSATSGTTMSNRVRLNFDTTFSGRDRLRARLQSRNITPLSGSSTTNTRMTRLGVDGDEGNATNLSLLQYTLPVFDRSRLMVETVGSEFNDNMYTFNPLLASSGSGALSRYGRFNPVYRQSGDGAGITLDHRISNELTGSIGYAVPGLVAANPSANIAPSGSGGGVFGGANAFIAQVRYEASPGINLGLNYSRSYSPNGSNVVGGTGSGFANSPFGTQPTSANHYNFLASVNLSPGFILSGWAGLTNASRENAAGNADIFNYAVTAAFPDLGGRGNLLGLIVGVPPKVTGNTDTARIDRDTSLHLEALYRVRVSNNLDITPGVLLITNPEHNSSRASEVVGTIRTTFSF